MKPSHVTKALQCRRRLCSTLLLGTSCLSASLRPAHNRLPEIRELLVSNRKMAVCPWQLCRGKANAIKALSKFIELQKTMQLQRAEAAEGMGTLTAFLISTETTQESETNFYFLLWGGLVINPDENVEVRQYQNAILISYCR